MRVPAMGCLQQRVAVAVWLQTEHERLQISDALFVPQSLHFVQLSVHDGVQEIVKLGLHCIEGL